MNPDPPDSQVDLTTPTVWWPGLSLVWPSVCLAFGLGPTWGLRTLYWKPLWQTEGTERGDREGTGQPGHPSINSFSKEGASAPPSSWFPLSSPSSFPILPPRAPPSPAAPWGSPLPSSQLSSGFGQSVASCPLRWQLVTEPPPRPARSERGALWPVSRAPGRLPGPGDMWAETWRAAGIRRCLLVPSRGRRWGGAP